MTDATYNPEFGIWIPDPEPEPLPELPRHELPPDWSPDELDFDFEICGIEGGE